MAIPVSSAYRIFWAGRYLERADTIARTLDVHFYRFLESGTTEADQESLWVAVLRGLGCYESFVKKYGKFSTRNFFEFMIFSSDNPSSILNALKQAGQNISGSMPDAVFIETNKLFLFIQVASIDSIIGSPHEFLTKVIQSCALISGMIDRLWS